LAIALSFDSNLFLIIRGLVSYLTFIFSFLASYIYFRRYGIPLNLMISLNVIWLILAVPQLVVNPFIYESFVQTRTTHNRGVTSLAAEPTFFAVLLIFTSWILISSTTWSANKAIRLLVPLNIIFIVFIAQSAMGVLYTIIFSLAIFMVASSRDKLKYIMVLCLVIPLLVFASLYYLEGSRLIGLTSMASNGLGFLIEQDASINSRLAHAILPLIGSLLKIGIPGGFGTFGEYAKSINLFLFDDFFYRDIGSHVIMSYLGAFFFELGFVSGVFFVCFILYCSGVKYKIHLIRGLTLCALLISAIPVNFPLVSIILALWLYQRKREGGFKSEVQCLPV
jgi:hypothetical protein